MNPADLPIDHGEPVIHTVQLGDIVFYKEVIPDGEKDSPSWPAIVYDIKLRDKGILGLSVFRSGIPYRFQAVYYDSESKPETWRYKHKA